MNFNIPAGLAKGVIFHGLSHAGKGGMMRGLVASMWAVNHLKGSSGQFGNVENRRVLFNSYFHASVSPIRNSLVQLIMAQPVPEQDRLLTNLMNVSLGVQRAAIKAQIEQKPITQDLQFEGVVATSQLIRDFLGKALQEAPEGTKGQIYSSLLIYEAEMEKIKDLAEKMSSEKAGNPKYQELKKEYVDAVALRDKHFEQMVDSAVQNFEKELFDEGKAEGFFDNFQKEYKDKSKGGKGAFFESLEWKLLSREVIIPLILTLGLGVYEYFEMKEELFSRLNRLTSKLANRQETEHMQQIWDRIEGLSFGLTCDIRIARACRMDELSKIDPTLKEHFEAEFASMVHDVEELKHSFDHLKLIINPEEEAKFNKEVISKLEVLQGKNEHLTALLKECVNVLTITRERNSLMSQAEVYFSNLKGYKEKLPTAEKDEIETLRKKMTRMQRHTKSDPVELEQMKKIVESLKVIHIEYVPSTTTPSAISFLEAMGL